MISSMILGSALASVSFAQSTVSLYIPGGGKMLLTASVVGSDSTATTYAVQCSPETYHNYCGFNDGGVFLTQGPATVAWTVEELGIFGTSTVTYFSGGIACSLAGTTSAVCTSGFTGIAAKHQGPQTTVYTDTDITFQVATLAPVTLSFLTAGAATPASISNLSVSQTGSKSVPQSTITSPSRTSSEAGVQSTSTGVSQSSSVSTGLAMPMVTRSAWALGRAVAVIAVFV